MNIKTNLRIVSVDSAGNVSEFRTHNMVVSTGLDYIRDRFYSTATYPPPYKFMLGSGSTPVASTDTALQTSEYDILFTGTTIRAAGVSFEGAIYSTDGHGTTSKEIGLFTSSSNIIARAIISDLIKSSDSPTNQYISWAFDFIEST